MLSSHPQYRKENNQQKRYLKPTLRRSMVPRIIYLAVILVCWLSGSFCCCHNPPADPDEERFLAVNCCPLPKVLVPRVLLPKKPPNSDSHQWYFQMNWIAVAGHPRRSCQNSSGSSYSQASLHRPVSPGYLQVSHRHLYSGQSSSYHCRTNPRRWVERWSLCSQKDRQS